MGDAKNLSGKGQVGTTRKLRGQVVKTRDKRTTPKLWGGAKLIMPLCWGWGPKKLEN